MSWVRNQSQARHGAISFFTGLYFLTSSPRFPLLPLLPLPPLPPLPPLSLHCAINCICILTVSKYSETFQKTRTLVVNTLSTNAQVPPSCVFSLSACGWRCGGGPCCGTPAPPRNKLDFCPGRKHREGQQLQVKYVYDIHEKYELS